MTDTSDRPVIDIEKQVVFWRDSALEDWSVAPLDSPAEARRTLARAEGVFQWLMSQL